MPLACFTCPNHCGGRPSTASSRWFTSLPFWLYSTAMSKTYSSTPPLASSLSPSPFFCFSDLVLAFMWASAQAFRMSPIRRKEFPQNLKQIIKDEDFVGLDVFICTADPYKEPPMNVVNTALSLMAYDYPTEKISIYVSDDGGSVLTLFAFMEAAKFARHWLPFCRQHNIMERSPHVYFESISHHPSIPQFEKIKVINTLQTLQPSFPNIFYTKLY
ncbi:hypothetical protein V6Z11_A09G217400 [Gossypium hirsutum]